MEKTVFFLGAGATLEDFPNAPLLRNLLWNMLVGSNDDEHALIRTNVRDFIAKYFFNLDGKGEMEYPTIQDVLSFIDAALLSETYFEIDKKYLKIIQRDIAYLMGRTIQQGMDSSKPTMNIARLIDKLDVADVITTNYDIVADNWFLNTFNPKMNYGVRFRNSLDVELSEQLQVDVAKLSEFQIYSYDFGPKLLKLHGSFNWLYCPRCNELDITLRQKGALNCWKNQIYCCSQSCTAPYEPLIVSPTFLKNYKNRIIREVWSLAEQSIAQAEEVIFIGYSMPADDYEIKSMLLRGIAMNKYGRPRITVIDKQPKDKKEEDENKSHCANYKKVFGAVTYQQCGFAKYAQEL